MASESTGGMTLISIGTIHTSGESAALTSQLATVTANVSVLQPTNTASQAISRAGSLRTSLPLMMGIVGGALVVILGLAILLVAKRRRSRLRVCESENGHAVGEAHAVRCIAVR